MTAWACDGTRLGTAYATAVVSSVAHWMILCAIATVLLARLQACADWNAVLWTSPVRLGTALSPLLIMYRARAVSVAWGGAKYARACTLDACLAVAACAAIIAAAGLFINGSATGVLSNLGLVGSGGARREW